MRVLILLVAVAMLVIGASYTSAANCDGLPVTGGNIPTGTYTLTDNCFTTGQLQVTGGTVVVINGNGFALDAGNAHRVLNVRANGALTLNNIIIRNGNVGDFGGGVYNDRGVVNINNSVITGNNAGSGGGIMNRGNTANMMIVNSVVTGNTANGRGVIRNTTGATMTIIHSTIANNSTGGRAGGIQNGAPLTITNSIVTNNTAPDGNCRYVMAITDGGGNIEDTDTCGFTVGAGSFPNTDPMLGAFNGTYFPLLEVSPAIDATPNCAGVATDQIGTSRPQGSACDIGSIEIPQTPDGEVIAPVVPAPPMCNEVSGDIVAFGLPDGVYCRVLMQNGRWMTNFGTVPGNLAEASPLIAVDVFRITGETVVNDDFGGYQQVCLPGEGRMIFLDATQSPRPQVEITPVEYVDGATCGWIPNAGTLVLLPQ